MNKIQIEDCQVLAHYKYGGGQMILTLASETIAKLTKPGQFVHITVDNSLEMRRPISVMSVDTENNSFDLLYKIVGIGTDKLAMRQIGDNISVLGPIGNGFDINDKKIPLLIGGGVGMPPMVAIAQSIQNNPYYQGFAVLASEVDFPFEVTTSTRENPCSADATYELLESWGMTTRLSSANPEVLQTGGIFNGYATQLAEEYLLTLNAEEIQQVQIYSCGPTPMLEAVKTLADKFSVPAQLSLEEYMACAVGGCAGCVVKTVEDNKEHMRRVCVDGPVFDSKQVFNEQYLGNA